MLLRIGALLVCLLMPSTLAAELTLEECAQIERLLDRTPQECQTNLAAAVESDGEPNGDDWQNHVFFPGGGSGLDAKALAKLETLSELLQGEVLGAACLQLIGHSDSTGGAAANLRLGSLRAEKVAEFLSALLADASRIDEHFSLGETRPLADRPPTDKWQRRVEIRARTCRHLG